MPADTGACEFRRRGSATIFREITAVRKIEDFIRG
jgi:hypothetical protein